MSVHKHICTAVLLLCAVAIANNTNEIVATHYDNTEAITIPKLLHYQGKLTTLAGLPVTDSTYSITFRLFNTLTGGSSFWNETQNIATNQGIFNVLLGTNNSIDTIPQSGNCYLEMQVNPNPAMTPRIRLVSSAYAYLSKKADTSNYALSANIQYVDSARIATNAHKLQGKDTIALSAKFVDEGQTNAITNTMITDNAVTSAKIQDGTIQLVDLAFTPATRPLTPGVSSSEILDGAISNFKIQANAVTTDKISDGTIIRQDVASTFKAPYADTSDYVRNVTLNYVDSARVATNAHKLQGKDTLALSNKFVDEGQANSITSAMIVDGTITNADISATAGISDIKLSGTGALITNLNADLLDGQHASAFALTNHTHAYVDSARISTNTYKLQGKDTLALSAKFVDEGQVNAISNAMITDNAIISSKIQDGTILRQDVAATFKAPYADTSDYVRNINITYVDSARVATNAHKLQGKDTTALDARYVNEGQTSSITSSMITDGTIIRDDVAPVFKAPYSDTADYARSTPPVGYIDSARVALDAYNAFKLQGQDTSDLSIKFINNGQTAGGVLTGTYPNPILKEAAVFSVHIADSTIDEIDIKDNAISSAKIINGTILREDVATNFKAPYADTSDYIRNLSVTYVDSARVSTNAHKLQGKDTTALDARYVNEGQVSSVNSAMILDLTITNADISNVAGISDVKLSGSGAIVSNFNADMLDGQHASAFSLTGHIHPYVDSARVSTNTYKLQGKDTLALSAKFVDENQTNAISTAMIIDGNVTMPKINQSGASTGQVIKWTGSSWAPSNDSIGTGIFLPLAGGTMTGAITSTGDPEITMGKANFGSGNLNTGIQAFVTGINNRARGHFSVVSGGGGGFHVADSNSAIGNYSTVGGGSKNIASGLKSTISGGDRNSATNEYTTVGGGVLNTASGGSATVSGGSQNIANNFYGTVSGGLQNSASGNTSTIGGGFADTANAMYSGVFSGCNNLAGDEAADTAAVVVGGRDNRATGKYTFIGGGRNNYARGDYSVVSGGGGATIVDSNSAIGNRTTIGGGARNIATGFAATISGGQANRASGNYSTASGGVQNTTSSTNATVSGGQYNTASGINSTVSGGQYNTASGNNSTIGGGHADTANAMYSGVFSGYNNLAGDEPADTAAVVVGGRDNRATSKFSFIGGGRYNNALGNYSVVSGGGGPLPVDSNRAYGDYSTISGGRRNLSGYNAVVGGGLLNIASDYATVGGGHYNTASNNATVGGGHYNTASFNGATISGGAGNTASGEYATVGAGESNTASGHYASIGGGWVNTASGHYASIGGGRADTVNAFYGGVFSGYNNLAGNSQVDTAAVVAGGRDNRATEKFSFIGGGRSNSASANYTTVNGGLSNTASGNVSTIGGGQNNTTSSSWTTVCGGLYNTASGNSSTVSGGQFNTASGNLSVVCNGSYNTASGAYATVGGGYADTVKANFGGVFSGYNNLAGDQESDTAAVVAGGYFNRATGKFSTVSGGILNFAAGDYSYAAGRRAKANHDGAFVWADGNNAEFASSANHEFNVRASGGTKIYSNSALTAGVTLATGASAWSSVSDSAKKRNIRPVDTKEILQKLTQMQISQWSYKAQDPSIEHIGPIAQDFYALFGLGEDDKTISTIDPAGIALAAIQELAKQNQELNAQNKDLSQKYQDLQTKLDYLLKEFETLKSQSNTDNK